MKLLRWWRGRSQLARFDYYVRASFYVNFVAMPILVGVALSDGWAGVTVPLVSVHALGCALVARAGLDSALGRRPRPTRLAAGLVALTAMLAVVAYAAFPTGLRDPANAALIVVFICLMLALSAALPLRLVLAGDVVACAAVYARTTAPGEPRAAVTIMIAVVLVGVTFAGWVSAWMLGVVWELDRARHVQASLAVAEERLRFARDLHDVVGRTLSMIALKSELAAQLARRGRDTAIDEMLEVRRIAQESVDELRAVVAGYRAADLDAELAGARSLLASAGIGCRMIGDGGTLPPAVQGMLGWAVREGTTNVLRHSDARTCTIELHSAPAGEVTLTMENDGVRGTPETGDRPHSGAGLVGLTERLAALNGTVTTERPAPDRFRLHVTLPAPAAVGPA